MFTRSILPIGLLFSASLILSNTAYLYLSVAYIQMLKVRQISFVMSCYGLRSTVCNGHRRVRASFGCIKTSLWYHLSRV